ncbi:MAG: hypothetical protein OEW19_05585, partial [Acidobacteriota bacterium]|nr:hypothetical protein [Acidobacteriota bacterium]
EAAASAFTDARAFASAKRASPRKAVERLAEFGEGVASAFNTLGSRTVFAAAPMNAVTQSVFLDATRAIADVVAEPRGMLTVTVLKPAGERAFALESFLDGQIPEISDIAVEQRLVSVVS